MDVLHTAIWVSDLEPTREFYCDGIGLDHSRDFTADGVRNYFVAGESAAEIQFKHDPKRDVAVTPDGIDHLAVAVDDIEETYDHLVGERGSESVAEPTVVETTGSMIAFVRDPDGYTVELIQQE